MTQGTPSDRALAAVQASGMNESPLASLEREDALFVLTDSTLMYQDGGGTRRVTLRDLTRIHSDQEGMLRVETPAGTALTASLLGFEPTQVQDFFKAVRTATGAAKNMPVSPLPSAGGAKTFGTASAPAASPAAPATPTAPEVTRENSPRFVAQPEIAQAEVAQAEVSQARPVVIGAAPTDQETAQMASAPAPVSPSAERFGGALGGREPMVISSSGYSPSSGKSVPAATAPTPDQPAGKTVAETPRVKSSAEVFREKADATPVKTMNAPQPAPMPAPAASMAAEQAVTDKKGVDKKAVERAERASEKPVSTTPASTSSASPAAQSPAELLLALTRQAEVVEVLVSRLRLLGGVLFVAAVALAYFQFSADSRLNALWTLLAGGVGSITLLALADMAKLLAALARTHSASSGAMDVK